MAFRVDVDEPGIYDVKVTTTSLLEVTMVSVNGMNGEHLQESNCPDAGCLIAKDNRADWIDQTWDFTVVAFSSFVEVEVSVKLDRLKEPSNFNEVIGIEKIVLCSKKTSRTNLSTKPTLFILGDSTVKSYIFEEEGMSGWGQIIYQLFDINRIHILNYSMGGRSFKSIYEEGRLNEVLLKGKPGDYILLQSGHNDESTGTENGPDVRFGRGNNRVSYEKWIQDAYIPSIRMLGMIPILVTPMTRIHYEDTDTDRIAFYGFKYSGVDGIDFPWIMKSMAQGLNVSLIDLYERSIEYITNIGGAVAKAIFMGVEAGELPSKTNSGSYANGNPNGSGDGTHYKEALSKQFARMIVEEIMKMNLPLGAYIKEEVKAAIRNQDWSRIYPECAKDIQRGIHAYYRNQIEKLVWLGAMHLNDQGMFLPQEPMQEKDFVGSLIKVWNLNDPLKYSDNISLTRERMAVIIMEAYNNHFGKKEDGSYVKPPYMTDYNGVMLSMTYPNYDPNLDGQCAEYNPMVTWEELVDTNEINEDIITLCQEAYSLGLMRSEDGIQRGKLMNGNKFQPKRVVTREKAAKTLYFLWVLKQELLVENHRRV